MIEIKDEAQDAYEAFVRIVRDLEKNRPEGEAVCVSGAGPNAREFFIQKTIRYGSLISIVGHTADEELEMLVFAPSQIALRLFTAAFDGPRRPIGFGPIDGSS